MNIKRIYLNLIITTLCVMLLNACVFNYNSDINTKISDEKQFNNISMNYFINKNIEELPMIANYISSNNIIKKNSKTKAPLIGFFAGIYHENTQVYSKLESMKLSKDTINILSLSKKYESVIEDMLNRETYVLESPVTLDSFWGYFFATGRDDVIKKICYTAQNSQDSIVKGAAKWSLKSNQSKFPSKIKDCSYYLK